MSVEVVGVSKLRFDAVVEGLKAAGQYTCRCCGGEATGLLGMNAQVVGGTICGESRVGVLMPTCKPCHDRLKAGDPRASGVFTAEAMSLVAAATKPKPQHN